MFLTASPVPSEVSPVPSVVSPANSASVSCSSASARSLRRGRGPPGRFLLGRDRVLVECPRAEIGDPGQHPFLPRAVHGPFLPDVRRGQFTVHGGDMFRRLGPLLGRLGPDATGTRIVVRPGPVVRPGVRAAAPVAGLVPVLGFVDAPALAVPVIRAPSAANR
jgi:hypothetical protein